MKDTILKIVFALLTAAGIALCIYGMITSTSTAYFAVAAATMVLQAMLLLYAFLGYRIPHGNCLKILMLAFAISILFDLNYCIILKAKSYFIVASIAMLIVAYISGRLNKIRKNLIPCILVLAALVYMYVNQSRSFGTLLNISGAQLLFWMDLCFAYYYRYKAHKEAGLED